MSAQFLHPVWLKRRVYHRGVDAPAAWSGPAFVKAVALPIPPFVGLGILADRDQDPCPIKEVFISTLGAVVCVLEDAVYDHFDCKPEDWASQLEYHTLGWTRLGTPDWDGYHLRPA